MKPEIGISNKHLESSVQLLSEFLADEMTLYIKTRKYHWNVSGNSFMELHQLFLKQYSELEETIDLIAERINKLGGQAIGTMQEFVELSRIKEHPGKNPEQKEMLKDLLCDHEMVSVELRKGIEKAADKYKDLGTADFLTGLLEQHETSAWILRRYLN